MARELEQSRRRRVSEVLCKLGEIDQAARLRLLCQLRPVVKSASRLQVEGLEFYASRLTNSDETSSGPVCNGVRLQLSSRGSTLHRPCVIIGHSG